MKIFPFRQGPLEEKIDAPLFGEIHHGDIIPKENNLRLFVYVEEEVHPLLLFELYVKELRGERIKEK